MPTYEYLCKTCGHRFETWQKMSDDPLTVCPNCGSPIHRVLFATGVVFKGSGFYSTETRAPQPAESSSSETPAAPAASAKNTSSGGNESGAQTDSKVGAQPSAPAASSTTTSSANGARPAADKQP
jgi:putative FmdB family regulatory protein